MLDASNNSLSRNIPEWLANMSSLIVLDLSMNKFSGNLPTQLGPSRIEEVYLSRNMLQGSLGTAFYNFSKLMILDLGHNYFRGHAQWISKSPNLGYILLSHNNLEGEIPVDLCSLKTLRLIDLSNNNLSGLAPSCIMQSKGLIVQISQSGPDVFMNQPLEFTTKSLTSQFQANILNYYYFSALDLSCNNLSGTVPAEFGKLNTIQGLNLSHNNFTGQIPKSFSNLKQIESLDLSYSNLDGKIPTQILELKFISHFNVSYNNLSGCTPKMVEQFALFENTCYVGNPLLCGPPLARTCSPTTIDEDEEGDEDGFMDMQVFYVTSMVTYVAVLLSIAAVLYINPYWRRRWFYMIQVATTYCGYFIEDNVFPLFNIRAS